MFGNGFVGDNFQEGKSFKTIKINKCGSTYLFNTSNPGIVGSYTVITFVLES